MSSMSKDLRRKLQQNNPLMIGEICGKLGKTMYLGVAISKLVYAGSVLHQPAG
jgi:hypothetical protein